MPYKVAVGVACYPVVLVFKFLNVVIAYIADSRGYRLVYVVNRLRFYRGDEGDLSPKGFLSISPSSFFTFSSIIYAPPNKRLCGFLCLR